MSASQSLPQKETKIFHSLARFHEKKQYKKALRTCEDILKVNKDHGETWAMKGLTYNHLDKKTEAYECVRKGIRLNIKSPICWHVYGLLHRSDGNYKEAKKCYFNAMKRDKNNFQILRDLALLQIQLRDLPGYLKTRRSILRLKQSRPDSWYTFAMAWELLGLYDEAIDVMIAFEDITEASEKKKFGKLEANFETGERKLYVAQLYKDAKRYQESIDYLKSSEELIVDKHGMKVMLAELYTITNEVELAKQLYRELIRTNPENHSFHFKLQDLYELSLNGELTDLQISELVKLYDELRVEFPRCSAVKSIPLRFLKPDDMFQEQLDSYVQHALRKGVPSLFANLEYFYDNSPSKAQIIGKTIQSYYDSLKVSNQFPGHENDELEESPLTLLWTILFLAQHNDKQGNTDKALEFIDEAIAHTPTVVDIYSFRADIYANAGAFQKAADAMDECRELDLADRYLNTKCTLFLMKADRVEQADKTIELFTRDADGICVSLSEMQCVWYEQAAADSYLRTKEYGKSLKKALSISSHFEDFIEDQFDFHSYCIRKLTLRAYKNLLSFEDQVYSHDNYFNAARTIVKNYIALHDRPLEQKKLEKERFAGLSGKELAKAQNKWKKAQKIKQAEEEKKKMEREKARAQKKRAGSSDDDPDGEKLEEIENPLQEAATFVSSMEKWCSDRLDTHLLSFEVYFRKEKYLRALKALKKSFAMEPSHYLVHTQLLRLVLLEESQVDESVRSIFVAQLKNITNGNSAEELNVNFAKSNSSVLGKIGFLLGELLIDPEMKESLEEQFFTSITDASCSECEIIASHVKKIYGVEKEDTMKSKVHEMYPLASTFET